MLIEKVREALIYFPKGSRFTLDYIPETWEFSSAPKNPSRLYIQVDELPELMSAEDELALEQLGWHNVDDLGEEWVLHVG
jgi:hypothetical protein